MKNDLTIAALQHIPAPNNVAAALQRLQTSAAQAAAEGCELLLVPECSITGYNQPLETMQQVAIESDGETADAIAAICRQHNIAIAYGFAEQGEVAEREVTEEDEQEYFNCVQITDASGNLSLIHI